MNDNRVTTQRFLRIPSRASNSCLAGHGGGVGRQCLARMSPGAVRSSARLGHLWCHAPGAPSGGTHLFVPMCTTAQTKRYSPLKQRYAIACNGLRERRLWEPLSCIVFRLLQYRRHRGRQAWPWRVMTGLEAEPADLFGLEQQSSDGLHPEEGSGHCLAHSHGMKVFDPSRAELTLLG